VVSHGCEAELRALDGYAGALLGIAWADEKRNPLRGDVLGLAVMRAIERITDVPAERKLLAREFGQALAAAMPACYRKVIEGFQAEGIQPVTLALRPADDVPDRPDWESSWIGTRPAVPADRLHEFERSLGGRPPVPPDTGRAGLDTLSALFERLMSGGSSGGSAPPAAPRSPSQDAAELQLTDLLRRLHVGADARGFFDTPAFASTVPGDIAPSVPDGHGGADAPSSELAGLVAVNLIRAHQDQLERAVKSRHDHLVIEIVGSLFDQILSDPKVPPQLARQIARLQLPVLRVALTDARFFSARAHPVRRFVNRVASLGCAFDRFDDGPGHGFLVRVTSLVDQIVEGDFERIETYEAKLDALQAFVGAEAERQLDASPAAPVLRDKETEWRVKQHFARQLADALGPLGLPPFVHSFLTGVWAQAIVVATRADGASSELAWRHRRVALDLVSSVQPKRSIEDRKRFLLSLPPLMTGLQAGMASVGWPQASREAFLGELMTVHAGSLKATPLTELDHNMRLRHAEAALRIPVPADDAAEVGSDAAMLAAESLATPVAASAPSLDPRFSAEEERALGLVSEGSVDWASTVQDADTAGEAAPPGTGTAELQASSSGAPPKPATAVDPSALPTIDSAALGGAAAGATVAQAKRPTAPLAVAKAPAIPSLREGLELGSAYELNLKGRWEKVRLTYMSPSRTLFLFAHGAKNRETVSMTSRLLGRLCDAGRLRAFERQQLVERSTERARQRIAAVPQGAAAA
jgi:hypothetical protein